MSLTWVALLRAIGPTTHAKLSMADLRAACTKAGLKDVQTVLATGNVIFQSVMAEPELTALFGRIVAEHDLENETFLRQPRELQAVLDLNPMPDAAGTRPNHMLVHFMAEPPSAAERQTIYAWEGPERVIVEGREAYIDFAQGVAGSKLTPARLTRLLGRPGTARNWNTVGKLVEKAG